MLVILVSKVITILLNFNLKYITNTIQLTVTDFVTGWHCW